MNIYVGNIPYSADEDAVRQLFEGYGEVQSVKLISDRETGRLKGFGFVEMEDEAGQQAIDELNQKEFSGRQLVVNQAREKRERNNFNRRY